MKLWLILLLTYFLLSKSITRNSRSMAAVLLFMWLSRQTSFKNLVKPWRKNTNFKKIKKSDLNQKNPIFCWCSCKWVCVCFGVCMYVPCFILSAMGLAAWNKRFLILILVSTRHDWISPRTQDDCMFMVWQSQHSLTHTDKTSNREHELQAAVVVLEVPAVVDVHNPSRCVPRTYQPQLPKLTRMSDACRHHCCLEDGEYQQTLA